MDEINLEARTKVLEMALNLEKEVNNLILKYLDIPNNQSRTLGHKSGGLTFKNKIDLLFDLEIISKEENSKFLLLMEIRNKFLHDIDCISYELATPTEKQKHLLQNSGLNEAFDMEARLSNGYLGLFIECLDIIADKHLKKQQELNERKQIVADYVVFTDFALKSIFDNLERVGNDYMPTKADSAELMVLKGQFVLELAKVAETFFHSDETKQFFKTIGNEKYKSLIDKYFHPKRK